MKGGITISEKNNNRKGITQEEDDFCKLYVSLRDFKTSAKLAGIKSGEDVLRKKKIQKRIAELEKLLFLDLEKDATAGMKRLAFYDAAEVASALESCVRNETGIPKCESFFGVSEIKFPKGGGVEVKFFDRFKALEKLKEFAEQKDNSNGGFIEALLKSGEGKDGNV